MTKLTIITMAAAGTAMFLWGCDIKDPIHKTGHPDKAKITVKTDWTDRGEGIPKPEEYFVAYDGKEQKVTGDEFTLPDLFDPGMHTLYFHNKPSEITVSGQTATVNADGTQSTLIDPMPGWLFTGKLDAAMEADKDYAFTVPMKQQVRELTLIITPSGGTEGRIASIEASLSGVAGSLDFSNDTHGAPASVAMQFSKITSGDDAGKWSATVRLLGSAGETQKLSGTITVTDGTPVDLPMESDLTTALAQFNREKKQPFILGGSTVETPTETGFTATIKDWEKKSASGTAS